MKHRMLRTGLGLSLCKAKIPKLCPVNSLRMRVLLLTEKMPISPLQMSHSLPRHAREGQRIRLIVASSPVRNARMQDKVNKQQLRQAKMVTGVRRTRQSNQGQERRLIPKMRASQQRSKSAKEQTNQGRLSRILQPLEQAKETSRLQASLRMEATSLVESLGLSHPRL